MSKVIRVRFRGGVLVAEEPLDMEEDEELLVKIIDERFLVGVETC